jgi:hypothetical protein
MRVNSFTLADIRSRAFPQAPNRALKARTVGAAANSFQSFYGAGKHRFHAESCHYTGHPRITPFNDAFSRFKVRHP